MKKRYWLIAALLLNLSFRAKKAPRRGAVFASAAGGADEYSIDYFLRLEKNAEYGMIYAV